MGAEEMGPDLYIQIGGKRGRFCECPVSLQDGPQVLKGLQAPRAQILFYQQINNKTKPTQNKNAPYLQQLQCNNLIITVEQGSSQMENHTSDLCDV